MISDPSNAEVTCLVSNDNCFVSAFAHALASGYVTYGFDESRLLFFKRTAAGEEPLALIRLLNELHRGPRRPNAAGGR